MVMYKKVNVPGATSRRMSLILRHPDTLTGLAEVPYRQETILIDFILQQWMEKHADGKTVQQAALDGTLSKHIEATINLAKKGRGGSLSQQAAPPVEYPAQTKSTDAAVFLAGQTPADYAGRGLPSPATPLSDSSPVDVLQNPQAPALHQAPAPIVQNSAPAEGSETHRVTLHETHSETRNETPRIAAAADDGEPPAPPADVAARLNSMFDN